jgi:hypothetical protein
VCGSTAIRSASASARRGLADTRFGGNQHHAPVAGPRLGPAAEQQIHLLVATRCRAGTQGFELAYCVVFGQDLPSRHPHGQTFQLDRAEVLALKQATDLSPGGRVDHHLVRPREALQACRKVRRLADRRLLAGVT